MQDEQLVSSSIFNNQEPLSNSEIKQIAETEFFEYISRVVREVEESRNLGKAMDALPNYSLNYREHSYRTVGFSVEDESKFKLIYQSRDEVEFFLFDENDQIVAGLFCFVDYPVDANTPMVIIPTIVTRVQGIGLSTVVKKLLDRFAAETSSKYKRDVRVKLIDVNGRELRILKKTIKLLREEKMDKKMEAECQALIRRLMYKELLQRPRWEAQFSNLGDEYLVNYDPEMNYQIDVGVHIEISESKAVSYSESRVPNTTNAELFDFLSSLKSLV